MPAAYLSLRATASSSRTAWSATSFSQTSGTLTTGMPASVAASTSMRSTPTPPLMMTLTLRSPLTTFGVMETPRPIMIASRSATAAVYWASFSQMTSTSSAPIGSSASRSSSNAYPGRLGVAATLNAIALPLCLDGWLGRDDRLLQPSEPEDQRHHRREDQPTEPDGRGCRARQVHQGAGEGRQHGEPDVVGGEEQAESRRAGLRPEHLPRKRHGPDDDRREDHPEADDPEGGRLEARKGHAHQRREGRRYQQPDR